VRDVGSNIRGTCAWMIGMRDHRRPPLRHRRAMAPTLRFEAVSKGACCLALRH